MPYKSLQQLKFFHSPGAKKAGITKKEVKEFDKASKGKELPAHLDKGGKVEKCLADLIMAMAKEKHHMAEGGAVVSLDLESMAPVLKEYVSGKKKPGKHHDKSLAKALADRKHKKA